MAKDNDIVVTPHGAFLKRPANDVSKPDIFKLQRSIFPPDGPVMVYNRDRSWQGQIAMTNDIMALFGESAKVYIIATPDAQGKLELISMIIPDDPF